MNSVFKVLASLAIGLAPLTSFASEGGAHGGGGGDMENEFKSIASNINGWIKGGGAVALTLPKNLSRADYRIKMQKELSAFRIEMVSQTLKFGGGVKTCVSAKIEGKNRIRCNQALFRDTFENNIDGAYRLVHHEFAGLALIERNQGANSDYAVSDQISKFLENQTVRRLPVGESNRYRNPSDLRTFMCGKSTVFQTYSDPKAPDAPEWMEFKSQVAAADYVRWMLKTKNPTLMAGMKKAGEDPSDEDSPLIVSTAVSMMGGGRVEDYTTTYLVPLNYTVKREEGVRVYIRVTVGYKGLDYTGDRNKYTPKADHASTIQLDGVFDPLNPQLGVSFDDYFLDSKKPIQQICHDVTIPVDHSPPELNTY